MLTRSTGRPRRTALLAVAVAGTALWASAPQAFAHGIIDARLTLQDRPGPNFLLGVDGWAEMSRAQAQRLIDSGHRIVIRIWGNDAFRDDLLLGPYRASGLTATPKGLGFRLTVEIQARQINEDNDLTVGGQSDEIYAGVRLVNAQGSTIAAHESNELSGPMGGGVLPETASCPANHIGCRR